VSTESNQLILKRLPTPRRLLEIDSDLVVGNRVRRRLVWSEPCLLCLDDIVWKEWVQTGRHVTPQVYRLAERRKLLCFRCVAKEYKASKTNIVAP
jgi:hypothetical protein